MNDMECEKAFALWEIGAIVVGLALLVFGAWLWEHFGERFARKGDDANL